MRRGYQTRVFLTDRASQYSLWVAADQVPGLYCQREGELTYRLWVSPSTKGLQLLDGGVRYASVLAKLPLREAPLTAVCG